MVTTVERKPLTRVVPFVLCFCAAPTAALLILIWRQQWILFKHLCFISCISIVYLCAILGWGRQILNRFTDRASRQDHSDETALALVLGISALYLIFLLFALIRLYRPIPVALTLVSGIFLFVHSMRGTTNEAAYTPSDTFDKILFGAVLLIGGIVVVFAWSPLIFYDALTYHIYAPATYLRSGGFVYIPLNFSANMPIALQFVLGSSAAFDVSGEAYKLLAALFALLMAAASTLIVKEHGVRAGLLGALIVVCYPGFWLAETLGIIDLAAAAFLIFGAIFLIDALKSGDRLKLLCSSLSLGMAAASRYAAILWVIWLLFICFIYFLFVLRMNFRVLLQRIVLCGAGVALLILPWLVKS